MITDIFELPPVAHIVAELDDETPDSDGPFSLEPWISPTRGPERRKVGVWQMLSVLVAPALSFR
ncbi:MAG TPA: hypothetical protein VIP11_05750 [Gemmatimonadaceae bacterium]